MTPIKVYGQNIKKEDYELIKAMVKIISPETPEILDIKSYEVNVKPDDVIFTFGTKATKMCAKFQCKAKLAFAEIDMLNAKNGTQQEREDAHQKLLQFKKLYNSGQLDNTAQKANSKKQILNESSIPDINQLHILEKVLTEKNISEWIGTSKDGRSIRLSHDTNNTGCDIEMTFAEFFALKEFMEIFKLKETKIVISNNN